MELVLIGMLTILLGIALVIIGSILTVKPKIKAEGGFIFWIGPIPLIGATNKRMFYAVIAITAIFLVFLLILSRKLIL
jgi:uncharacterized membrane protein